MFSCFMFAEREYFIKLSPKKERRKLRKKERKNGFGATICTELNVFLYAGFFFYFKSNSDNLSFF